MTTDGAEANWAGNVHYSTNDIRRPATIDQLSMLVPHLGVGASVLGSRHSFNRVADGAELISLAALPERFEISPDRRTVTANGSMTYGRLCAHLAPEGLAVHNLASLPHISIAGSIATGTHGSGLRLGNLATSVAGLDTMGPDGNVRRFRRGDADFDGAVVSMGALGVVLAVTLDVEPVFDVAQHVIEAVPWPSLLEGFDELMGETYSVSAFTRFDDVIDQIWFKDRIDEGRTLDLARFGGRPATQHRHPIFELDAAPCTPQLGQVGRWADRLPHFRMGFTPSAGEEIQSEFFVARLDAPAAIEALRSAAPDFALPLMVAEIRCMAADGLWASPAYGRDSVGFHFTWERDAAAVERSVEVVERALAPFAARPHWGKVFSEPSFEPASVYERWDDFCSLVERVDPAGVFRTPWLDQFL